MGGMGDIHLVASVAADGVCGLFYTCENKSAVPATEAKVRSAIAVVLATAAAAVSYRCCCCSV